MNTEEKLIKILTENKKLTEELNMKRKLKEQNEADKDLQAPINPTDSAPKSDGTTATPSGASQDDLKKKYEENEADKDTQAPATPDTPVAPSTGADDKPEGASQDDMADKYAGSKLGEQADTDKDEIKKEQVDDEDETKKEQVEDEDETKKEQVDDEDEKKEQVPDEDEKKDLVERFKEMQDDMGKVTDILEVIKDKVDVLEKEVGEIKNDEQVDMPDEPEPPMTESRKLRDVFIETVTAKPDDFRKVMKEVIYKK